MNTSHDTRFLDVIALCLSGGGGGKTENLLVMSCQTYYAIEQSSGTRAGKMGGCSDEDVRRHHNDTRSEGVNDKGKACSVLRTAHFQDLHPSFASLNTDNRHENMLRTGFCSFTFHAGRVSDA